MTRSLSPIAVAMLTAMATPAQAQTLYDGTASSSIHVESVTSSDAGKAIVMSVRNARLVPYVIYVWREGQKSDADALQARLATITTDVKTPGPTARASIPPPLSPSPSTISPGASRGASLRSRSRAPRA